MFSALKDRGIATCLLIFQGENHGFRQSGHVRQSLEAELLFYAINLIKGPLSVALLTDDSQIGANLRVCADEENRADFDQRR